MSKRHADSTPDEKAPKRRKLSADEVLVEAARNGDTTAVRAGLEKLSPDTDSKTVAFDAVHEACRGNHDECLALLLPYVETTQMGFGMLLSECIHADHTACTEVLLQHWKSVCSNVAFVRHGQEDIKDRPCPAMWEDPAVCQVLIDAGTDIETKDDMGRSPLHLACRSGALDVVKVLVKAGAGVCVADHEGHTCLTLAAYNGHTETVRYLVSLPEMDVNHMDEYGYTAVLAVAEVDHPDVMEVLIDAGADIEVKGSRGISDGLSPLLVACHLEHLRVVKVLVRAGAEVCVTDYEGDTCLSTAVGFGNTETVCYLLGLPEVDVNHADETGLTALHGAVMQNDAKLTDVMQLLIDAGADIDAKDEDSWTPLMLNVCEPCRDYQARNAITTFLVAAGASVRTEDSDGNTCLTLATRNGITDMVRYFVGLPEVDVNHANQHGETALYHARYTQQADLVKVLLEHGAEE